MQTNESAISSDGRDVDLGSPLSPVSHQTDSSHTDTVTNSAKRYVVSPLDTESRLQAETVGLKRWIHSFVIVDFDIEIGQGAISHRSSGHFSDFFLLVVERVVPADARLPHEQELNLYWPSNS